MFTTTRCFPTVTSSRPSPSWTSMWRLHCLQILWTSSQLHRSSTNQPSHRKWAPRRPKIALRQRSTLDQLNRAASNSFFQTVKETMMSCTSTRRRRLSSNSWLARRTTISLPRASSNAWPNSRTWQTTTYRKHITISSTKMSSAEARTPRWTSTASSRPSKI